MTANFCRSIDGRILITLASGGQAAAVAGDVKDESLAQALIETAVGRFGSL